jgi:hypothetical protein
VIDLVPSTACIYKRPYRMATQQSAELKEHIKELLEKGYIHPISSLWGAPLIFVTEPPRGGVRCQDQVERFSMKRDHNKHT